MKIFTKSNKNAWFVPVRWSYLPRNWQGGLTYIPMLAYLIFVMAYTVRNIDAIAQIVLFVVPNFIAVGVLMHWIASHKS